MRVIQWSHYGSNHRNKMKINSTSARKQFETYAATLDASNRFVQRCAVHHRDNKHTNILYCIHKIIILKFIWSICAPGARSILATLRTFHPHFIVYFLFCQRASWKLKNAVVRRLYASEHAKHAAWIRHPACKLIHEICTPHNSMTRNKWENGPFNLEYLNSLCGIHKVVGWFFFISKRTQLVLRCTWAW